MQCLSCSVPAGICLHVADGLEFLQLYWPVHSCGLSNPRRGRYFICTDTVLIMQFIYYGTLQRRRERLRSLRSRPRPSHAPPHHRLHAPSQHAHALPPYRPLPSEVRSAWLTCGGNCIACTALRAIVAFAFVRYVPRVSGH